MQIHYFYDGSICRYEYFYPNDFELLNIFPETREIIPIKLKEWLKLKRYIVRTETKPYLLKCGLCEPLKAAFWKTAYQYMAYGFNSIMAQIARLERLQDILQDPTGSAMNRTMIARAKSTPLIQIYSFVRRGTSYICPIHADKDPSLHIYKDNTWHCFGCNKGGDTIDFVQAMFNIGFYEAVKYITKGVSHV